MEKSSFFNSVNGDRRYFASDFAEFFNSFITNGVFPNPSTKLQVLSNSDMTITVKTGKGWINGYNYYNDSDLILSIEVADGVLNRIDRIAIRYDIVDRAINAVVKKGAFASSPVAPTLERDADYYELGIADIYVAAGTTSISQSNITDLRLNGDLCGLVSFVDPIDPTAIFNQYQDWFNTKTNQYNTDMSAQETQFQSDFNTWFDTIKGQLGTDAAGNLQNQINSLSADYAYQTAGGTATTITLTGVILEDGHPKTFIAGFTDSNTVKTINGKPFYNPGTTTSPSTVAGKAYTIWYNLAGDCFFIKASATGTVTPDKVLAGETFSTEVNTDQVGTRDESQLTADNIRKDITIAGITGNKLQYGAGDKISTTKFLENTPLTVITQAAATVAFRPGCTDNINYYYWYYTGSGYYIKIINKATYAIAQSSIQVTSSNAKIYSCNDGYFYTVDSANLRKWNATTGVLIWTCALTHSFGAYSSLIGIYADSSYIYVMGQNGTSVTYQKINQNGTSTGAETYDLTGYSSSNFFSYDKYCYFIFNNKAYCYDMTTNTQVSNESVANTSYAYIDYLNKITYAYASSYEKAYNYAGTQLWVYFVNNMPTALIIRKNGVYIDDYFANDVNLDLGGNVVYKNTQPYVYGLQNIYCNLETDELLGEITSYNGSATYYSPCVIYEKLTVKE